MALLTTTYFGTTYYGTTYYGSGLSDAEVAAMARYLPHGTYLLWHVAPVSVRCIQTVKPLGTGLLHSLL